MALPAWAEGDAGWQAKGACYWRRDADSFVFNWPSSGVAMGLDNLHATARQLHADVTVEYLGGGHLGYSRHDLWSNAAQATLRRHLEDMTVKPRRDEAQVPIPWAQLIEQAFSIAKRSWNERREPQDMSLWTPGSRPLDHFPGFAPFGAPTVVYGAGGGGKSQFLQALMLSTVTGRAFDARFRPAVTGPGLYLDWEDDDDTNGRRACAVLAGMGLPAERPPRGYYYQFMDRPLVEAAKWIEADIERLGVKVVLVDSLQRACRGSVKDDDVASEIMNVVRRWKSCTTFLVGHVPKFDAHGDGKTAATIIGSVVFENMARQVWELRKSGDIPRDQGMAIGLYDRKRNRGIEKPPVGLRLHFEGDPDFPTAIRFGGWSVDGDPTLAQGLAFHERVLAIIRRMGAMDKTGLAAETGESEEKCRKAAQYLVGRGKLAAGGGGRGAGNKTMYAMPAPRYRELEG